MDYTSDEMAPVDVNLMYISSYDALHRKSIDQSIPPEWNDRPPLFPLRRSNTNDGTLLKGMLRRGVPPALRCAVWISSVVSSCHPHQPEEYAEEYRTLGKARALDYAWDSVLRQVFSNEDEKRDTVSPTFGADLPRLLDEVGDISEKGEWSMTHVLCALEHVVGLDFAPLFPTLAILTMQYMSESYVFCILREMSNNSSWYLPTSPLEHHAWCRAFSDVLHRLHPQTAAAMRENGSLTPQGLDPIFRYMFIPILPIHHVMRIMDVYTLEGAKVLFRFGVALLCLFKRDLKDLDVQTKEEWWAALKQYTHAPSFSMEVLTRKAYGYHGSRQRRRVRFPRRHILARIIKLEEERAMQDEGFDASQLAGPPRPLGLVQGQDGILAKSTAVRTNLASWLPMSLQLTKLDLIYSTSHHGRTLERFYAHVSQYKHTFLLCQVLETNATIGMFASQAWHISSRVYGDGGCFLFRAQPDAAGYHWKPTRVHAEEDVSEENHTALLEQFMVARENFISMGGNPDGTSGLRINEDLTKGESATAEGFHNEPLAQNVGRMFEIGLVEVYRLVRQVDGKGVDY